MAASTRGEVALRKRQQIDSSKRTMFIAVAAAALVVGAGVVIMYFLFQQILFNSKVYSSKQETVDTLKSNISAAEELKQNIRVLDTSAALKSVQTSSQTSSVQAVLDALPAEANADALGASLQTKFVGAVNGLKLESLQVDAPEAGDEEETADTASIMFTMTVSGSASGLKELLTRFERSIRVIDMTDVSVQANADQLSMTIQGRAFYEPARVVELGTKVVKP